MPSSWLSSNKRSPLLFLLTLFVVRAISSLLVNEMQHYISISVTITHPNMLVRFYKVQQWTLQLGYVDRKHL